MTWRRQLRHKLDPATQGIGNHRLDPGQLVLFRKRSSERVLPTEYELFDLRRDPAELHNVVDDPDYAAVRLELEAELGRPQDKYADEPYQGPQTPRLHWST